MGRAEDYSSSRQYSVHGSFSGQNSNSAVCGNSFRPGIVARLTKRVLECRGRVLCIMLHIWGLGFLLSWITQSYGEACTEQHRKQNNSLLEIDGLQVGTRWMSDKHVKGTHPLHKFRKILL